MPSIGRTDAASETPSTKLQSMGSASQAPSQTEISTTPAAAQPEPVSGSAAQTSASTQAWHAVWKPFRSHMAASGFAERLALLTDREYRVTRLAVGAYQVEVGFDPNSGVADTLNQIRMMTGLRVSEIQP